MLAGTIESLTDRRKTDAVNAKPSEGKYVAAEYEPLAPAVFKAERRARQSPLVDADQCRLK